MDHAAPQTQPDPGYLSARDNYYHLIHTLSTVLPPPAADTPEARACRDSAAIAQVAALCPANATEATLAAQYVAANAQALDCLHLANAPETEQGIALKCTAQAASMMRQAHGALRLLQRLQAESEGRMGGIRATDRAASDECRAGNRTTPAATLMSLAASARPVPTRRRAGARPASPPQPADAGGWTGAEIHLPPTLRRGSPFSGFGSTHVAADGDASSVGLAGAMSRLASGASFRASTQVRSGGDEATPLAPAGAEGRSAGAEHRGVACDSLSRSQRNGHA
jgi:hypothetical protein